MTYQQYLDYASIRSSIDNYNSTYAPAYIHLDTPEGSIKLPATSTDNAKVLIDSEQLRKDYPTFTNVTIAADALIMPLPSINTVLKIPSDIFTARITYLTLHAGLDLYAPILLTKSQFNYLISGDPNVLRPNN